MIGEMVYVGGGDIFDDDWYLIHEYNSTEDNWTTLPPALLYWFGMGELSGQLVTVGGMTAQKEVSGKVYTFDKCSQEWTESVPSMPTARHRSAVFSQPSCLTVIGGRNQHGSRLSDVEIFIPLTSQWHKVSPAPSPLSDVTTTVIHNTCYLSECDSNKIHQLSVTVLVSVISSSSSNPQINMEWKRLPDLPYGGSSLASFNGSLLAVGGIRDTSVKAVLAFLPSTNTWKIVSDLPESRFNCTTALLSTGELLVVGGNFGDMFVTEVTFDVWKTANLPLYCS